MKRWLISLVLLLSSGAQAAVSLSGTRLIFDGAFGEVSIEVRNRSDHEVLLQTWLSEPSATDVEPPRELPFVVTPHLSQLPANGRQALRILYEGVGMPLGRESLLHLYVMEIPRRSEGENQLSIAIRQRINVFYRPPGLSGDPADTAQRLRWQLSRDPSGNTTLQVSNPTAYHASVQHLQLGSREVSDYLLLPPAETLRLPLPEFEAAQKLTFKALTDYGGQRNFVADADWHMPFSARLLPDATSITDVQP
ncbi:molecular chaperone [Pseudomonas sp. NA-150]|uniref:fimbrial biogenesis chaperone n=1 Tax=Pseudomonas sp. NA-150 TaxID=3367525 RepID=UPI0037C6A9A9